MEKNICPEINGYLFQKYWTPHVLTESADAYDI